MELYNTTDRTIDLADWYLTDKKLSHKLPITPDNTDTGDTKITPHGYLVVYRDGDSDFTLGNKGDTVRLRQEVAITFTLRGKTYTHTVARTVDWHRYVKQEVREGKSIARFPDGGVVWIDPEATPGDDNEMTDDELAHFRAYTFEKCFDKNGKRDKDAKDTLCDGAFLAYLGMIKNEDGTKLIFTDLLDKEEQKTQKEDDDRKKDAKKDKKVKDGKDVKNDEKKQEFSENSQKTDGESAVTDDVVTEEKTQEEKIEKEEEKTDDVKTEEDEQEKAQSKDEESSDDEAIEDKEKQNGDKEQSDDSVMARFLLLIA